MTVESQVSKTQKMVMGATNTYDFFFHCLTKDPTEEAAKQAIKVSISDGVNKTELTYGTDYTVKLNDDGTGGTVTVADKKTSAYSLIVYREYDYRQSSDYQNYNAFPADTLEHNLDKATMLCQQLQEQANRAVTVDVFSDTDPAELVDKVETLYADKDNLDLLVNNMSSIKTDAENIGVIKTAANNIGAVQTVSGSIEAVKTVSDAVNDVVLCAAEIVAIKDAPNQANSARNSAIEAQNSAVTAQLMAAQAGESVSAAAASASAADASAAASAGSAQTAQDYAWQVVRRNIGDIFYTARLDAALNGAVECNGAQYNVADFTGPQAVPALLSAGKLPYVSITAFDAAVAANGSCRCFGWDGEGSAVFKVPKLNDVYIMAGTAASADEYIPESLPNVAVNTGANVKIATSGAAGASSGAGALFIQNHSVTTGATMGGATAVGYDTLYLDMSRSNTVFKNGAKVRPDSIRYRAMVQVATSATDEALETCSGVLADVAGLKDASNFTATGKSILSGLGMPSNKAVDLTVGASGARYTAPGNGYFSAYNANGANGAARFVNITKGLGINSPAVVGLSEGVAFVPAETGDVIDMFYTGTFNATGNGWFRFVYAKGESNV